MLKRGSSGQFHLSGEVNGQAVRFLVDTGADVVALTEDSAEAIGIQVPAADGAAFSEFLDTLAYPFTEETDNPVYRLFLR